MHQQTPALSLQSMAPVIDQYIKSIGGTEFLNIGLERSRLDLLKRRVQYWGLFLCSSSSDVLCVGLTRP